MTRLEKLKDLELRLAAAMTEADARSLAGIARQYRETIREIEDIEGVEDEDEIGDVINGFSDADV